ncbi:hypothetical protein CAPTEDRAFT_192032 [Capitella teleta]|uniref:G-protein coupled receptors family 1 profile domain-containing protein n=1 Tax=Capitella teleta TaxID=283909 RepID=R7TGE9_CAPTE|nr:hypothetical protein CAPTEDRAFT_192032 [Capitella teleta]|eukprot:ELT90646.1 hypothetical protein CAPTEDRAFT_192032 [Capitella teleta]
MDISKYGKVRPMRSTTEATWDTNNATQASLIHAPAAQDITAWYKYALISLNVVLLVGLVLNLVTAIAYVKSPLLSRGKPVHQLIFNMTIGDGITCLASQPFVLFLYTDAGQRYIVGRKFQCIASMVGMLISFDSAMMALILITCERLFAIHSPLQHMHRVTKKSCRVAILIAWTIILAKNVSLFFMNKWQSGVPCVGITVMTEAYVSYVYNLGLYTMLGSVALLNILLSIVVIVAKRKAGTMSASETMTKSVRRQIKSTRSEMKIVKIVFLAVGVLFLTWIPHNTLANVAQSYVSKQQAPPFGIVVGWHMTRSLAVLGTIADPLIYFLQNSGCHSAVLSLFGRSEAQKQSIYSLDSQTISKAISVVSVESSLHVIDGFCVLYKVTGQMH